MLWTIYNHGTGGSSLKSASGGEIVNLFGNNDRTPEYQGKIITEGVGSIGDPKDLVQRFGRTQSGDYFVQQRQGKSGGMARLFQTSVGTGVKENVQSTLEYIRALNLAGQCPTQINMLGWSRGAVTCIRLAYELSQSQDPVLRNIPVNIFAVDAVAGFGHNTEVDAMTINSNVKNYLATMATGEHRFFFKPIVCQRLHINNPGVTQSWIIPMPGVHNQTASNTNYPGKLTFDLAYRFLTTCGTPLGAVSHYKVDDLTAWSYYEALMFGTGGDLAAKTTKWKGALTTGGGKYERTGEARRLSIGEKFFINYHAEKVFAQAYPVCYDAYFSPAHITTRNSANWRMQFARPLTAEQSLTNMSPAMKTKLDLLPAALPAPAVSATVTNLINNLNLVG